jgi:CMD domain protein
MSQPQPDIINLLAGIAADSPLASLRSTRAQATEYAQASFTALLEPEEPGTFPLCERYAIAAFTARLHGFAQAAEFYRDILADEAPALVAPIHAAGTAGVSDGPHGAYREEALAAESIPRPAWTPDACVTSAVGDRLAAALRHTHLLVFRPRESGAADLRALAASGWNADDIVRLSQLVAFLAFQLRTAWALRVLQQTPSTDHFHEGATA